MKCETSDRQTKQKIKIYLGVVIIFVCILVSVLCITSLANRYDTLTTEHTENSKVDYKAYLLEGTPFIEKYKKPGETIVAQALDYIDLDLSYSDEYTSKINGSYEYYTRATVQAMRKSASKVDYSYPISLTEPSIKFIDNSKIYLVDDKVSIKYNTYNEILNNYKKQLPYSMDGYVVIELLVKRNISVVGKDIKVVDSDFKPVVTMKVPLSEQVIDISLDNNTTHKTSSLKSEQIKKKGVIYVLAIPITVIMIATAIIVLIKLLEYVRSNEKTYLNKLNKILSTYDAVIVKTNNIPSVDGVDVLEVQSFEELIDAHSEVRQPINFFEDKKHHKCYFILHNGSSMAWKYVLRGKSPNKKDVVEDKEVDVKKVDVESINKDAVIEDEKGIISTQKVDVEVTNKEIDNSNVIEINNDEKKENVDSQEEKKSVKKKNKKWYY